MTIFAYTICNLKRNTMNKEDLKKAIGQVLYGTVVITTSIILSQVILTNLAKMSLRSKATETGK